MRISINTDFENRNLVLDAYRKLKQNTYHDTVNLFLRKRIAEFETSKNFEQQIDKLTEYVSDLKNDSDKIPSDGILNTLLKKVDVLFLPKKIQNDNNSNSKGIFISNDRSQADYDLESVNYFIDAPVALFVLDVIWSLKVGVILDRTLHENCLGNRLKYFEDDKYDESSQLFKIFHTQYKDWRDNALKCALNELDNKKDILFIGLDIKECYYHLETDWKRINDYLKKSVVDQSELVFLQNLTNVLREIYTKYHQISSPLLEKTHKSASGIQGLPIGLTSSQIIANWMLKNFDDKVIKKLQPSYYGRYVDDILIVMQSPDKEIIQGENNKIINEIFVKTELLVQKKNKIDSDQIETEFVLSVLNNLEIQQDKFVIQHFDHKHSRAGLSEFQREIDEQASEFRFLPRGDDHRGLDECAFDIQYKGSINKLRSVIGLEENSTELSKYLSRKITQHRLCSDESVAEHIDQLFRFYKGRNIFDFCRLWEKVFILFLTNNREADCAKFYNTCKLTIEKLKYNDDEILNKVINDANLYLNASLSLTLALREKDVLKNLKSKNLKKIINPGTNEKNMIQGLMISFRESNMLRHHFVSSPLTNYTDYSGNYLEFSPAEYKGLKLSDKKVKWSPRYIHNDERQLFNIFDKITQIEKDKPVEFLLDEKNDDVPFVKHNPDTSIPFTDVCFKASAKESIRIGIVNLKVPEEDIEKSFHPRKKPNISIDRQSVLYDLINEAIKKPKCDLVVFPELSIPLKWLPLMINQARKNQVGLVFGLEYWVVGDVALNLIVTVLPYKKDDKYLSTFVSLRIKNHYAPLEGFNLKIVGYSIPKVKKYYEKYCWNGCTFSTYYCFELANIHHRGLFRSELDFLIASVWNKDVKYYSNIIESVSRDLHCYVIQSNTSHYGDSRITAPQKNEVMDYVRVKGGTNPTLLKSNLDLEKLRNFQSNLYRPDDKSFKPTPAGYDHDKARNRARCEVCKYQST